MNISEPFIRRPIATSLVMLGVLVFGIGAYGLLPVAALPNVDFPTITVGVTYPGASPDTMASAVATPLEQQFAAIPALDQMTSTSGVGSLSITLQFDLSRNIDAAAQDVQQAINAASGLLPPDLPSPPTYRKTNPADRPVLIYAVHSNSLPIYKVDDYAYTILAQKLSTVPGVSEARIFGQQPYAAHIQINPGALASRGLGFEDVRNALIATTLDRPKGNLEGAHQTYTLDTNDQLFNAAAYDNVIIAYRNGAPVRVKDVGKAIDSVQNARTGAWYFDTKAEGLAIQRQAGANTLRVVDTIKAMIPRIMESFPPSIKVDLVSDRSLVIRAAVHDVQFTMMLTIGLVVLVIFVFLRTLWATIIPSLAVPLSTARDVRDHVRGRLQPRQHLADGVDDLGRLYRRRRRRHDRKHHALHPCPEMGDRPFSRRAQGADRSLLRSIISIPIAPCADRGVHPAPADGRDHRPAVPRVRRHRFRWRSSRRRRSR